MTEEVLIYHNPRCSKSRQTLALLKEHGVQPRVVEYLKEGLTQKTVEQLIEKLSVEPHQLLRTKEEPYKRLALSPKSARKTIVDAIALHPILLERPIVLKSGKAALGRPPENVLTLL